MLGLFLREEKIWNLKNRHNIPSMEWSLMNIRSLGFDPLWAIDVGAFEGEWTKMFKKVFPKARVLMLEGQRSKQIVLENLCRVDSSLYFYTSVLGAEAGRQVDFNINSTVSSVLEEYQPYNFEKEPRTIETIDNIMKGLPDFHHLDFIKLDVQGYEMEVLKGAKNTISSVSFVLCEVSLIEINKGCPLIGAMITFMDDLGFRLYDICSFIRRPLDRALWQTDLLFIRKEHPLIRDKTWG